LAEGLGITSAAQLAELVGIGRNSAYIIWQGKTSRIGLDTVDKLCDWLGQDVAGLFERTTERRSVESIGARVAEIKHAKHGRPRTKPAKM
jgi:DNA-binding Xre family transcriptional regulator